MVKKKHIVVESDSHSPPYDSPTPHANPEAVAQAVPDTADQVKELEEKLAEAIAQADEKHDRMLRMAAELDNFRKRSAREMDELKKYANENLLHQLLTVVDNLERAIASAAAANKTDQQLVDGVALTLAEISKMLEKHHVSPIKAIGETFDPVFHQAMCQEPRMDHPPNTVVQEFQKGYLIHDRLLRPAMVVVSTAAPQAASGEQSVDTHA